MVRQLASNQICEVQNLLFVLFCVYGLNQKNNNSISTYIYINQNLIHGIGTKITWKEYIFL